METLYAKLDEMGYKNEAEKVKVDLARAKEAAAASVTAPRAKRVLDAAHKLHRQAREIVEEREARISKLSAQLAEENVILTQEKAEVARTESILKQATEEFQALLEVPTARQCPEPMQLAVQAQLRSRLQASAPTLLQAEAEYEAARQHADTLGGELSRDQHHWNFMIKCFMGTFMEVMGTAATEVGRAPHTQIPSTPLAPGDAAQGHSQASTVAAPAGAVAQAVGRLEHGGRSASRKEEAHRRKRSGGRGSRRDEDSDHESRSRSPQRDGS